VKSKDVLMTKEFEGVRVTAGTGGTTRILGTQIDKLQPTISEATSVQELQSV